jgi:molybdenum-dependent DNA-binding transcriptional regulator ModE
VIIVKRWGGEGETEAQLRAQLRKLTEDVRNLRKEMWRMTAEGRRKGSASRGERFRLHVEPSKQSAT